MPFEKWEWEGRLLNKDVDGGGQATGAIQPSAASIRQTMKQQGLVGLLLGAGLSGKLLPPTSCSGSIASLAAWDGTKPIAVEQSILRGDDLGFMETLKVQVKQTFSAAVKVLSSWRRIGGGGWERAALW